MKPQGDLLSQIVTLLLNIALFLGLAAVGAFLLVGFANLIGWA